MRPYLVHLLAVLLAMFLGLRIVTGHMPAFVLIVTLMVH
jgi:hypothetical protein